MASNAQQVTFQSVPIEGQPAHIILGGQPATTSPVTLVQTHPQYPGWYWVNTQSGSRYGGMLASTTAPASQAWLPAGTKSKTAAGLLGVFLGFIGIHRFYLGFTAVGVIQILVTFATFGIGSLWGFIEGILILTGSINRDASGNLLSD